MSVRRIPAYCLPIAMFAAPVQAQSDNGMERGLFEVSAEALAASEERVKTWFADPDVSALRSRADGGSATAQVQFGDRIRDDVLHESWSHEQLKQNMLKYYAMAMGQEHGPAFARVGFLTESVEYGMRDLDQAMEYYELGAELGDREAIAGYTRIAFNPAYCRFCEDGGEYKTDLKKVIAAGLGSLKRTELDKVYQEEKRAMVAKAVNYARVSRPKPGDEASHLLAGALQNGIPVPEGARVYVDGAEKLSLLELRRRGGAQWLLKPDMDEAIIQLSNMSGRGDILASRKLADIYLNGRSTDGRTVAKDPEKYAFYMQRAVDAGSTIAAYALGFELLSGEKIPANHARGFEYLAKAALAGFGPAQVTAAYALREGRGVDKNEALALSLFEKAANNSQLEGAEQAAAMHRAGLGTPGGRRQIPDAVAWEKKAEAMRAMTPLMADAVRRAHWDKFE